MQREIKFRAIELSKKYFVYGSLIVGTDLSGLPFHQIENADANEYRKWTVAENTIGQYIGIKDKNGNEVYEGDIVKGCTYYPDENFQPVKLLDAIGAVKWVDEWLAFGIDKDQGIVNLHDLEIIGNIYENANLLKPINHE